MSIQLEDILKLLLALGVGGLIGIERELRDKAAGFRTMMYICAGSTLFTIFSYKIVADVGLGDPARIAAQIVSGVGFLGAGAILRERGEVRGLTTASTVWLAAALGMGVGAGFYLFSVAAAVILLLSLFVFPSVEGLLVSRAQFRTYVVTCKADLGKLEQFRQLIDDLKLRLVTSNHTRREDLMICTWMVSGRAAYHKDLVEKLFQDPDIIEFTY